MVSFVILDPADMLAMPGYEGPGGTCKSEPCIHERVLGCAVLGNNVFNPALLASSSLLRSSWIR